MCKASYVWNGRCMSFMVIMCMLNLGRNFYGVHTCPMRATRLVYLTSALSPAVERPSSDMSVGSCQHDENRKQTKCMAVSA